MRIWAAWAASIVLALLVINAGPGAAGEPNVTQTALPQQIDEAIAAMPLRVSWPGGRGRVVSTRTAGCKTVVQTASFEGAFEWTTRENSPRLHTINRHSIGGYFDGVNAGLYFDDPEILPPQYEARVAALHDLLVAYWRSCEPPEGWSD